VLEATGAYGPIAILKKIMEPAEQAPAPACKCTKMAQEEWKSCHKKIEMI
jgi:hypothetical protein